MKSPLRRRVTSGALLLLLVPLLAACGFGYQTDQVYQPATGTNDRSGQVYILNAMVVTVNGGKGTFAGTLVNEGETQDKLISVTGPGIQSSSQSQVTIPPGGIVNLSKSGQVWVSGPDIKPGSFVHLSLQFANGQSTEMDVPVITRTGYYGNVALPGSGSSPRSSQSPSPSPSQSPSASSSPTSSPSSSQ